MELLTTLTPLINRIALDVIMVTGLGAISALLLVTFSARFRDNGNEVVTQINRTLPQTQCAQCGYPGCLPYAEAIAAGESINKCPPGGDAVIHELATLLGRPFQALDSALTPQAHPTVAYIREEECIGCTLCIAACPIDAIIGAPGLMHTVLSNTCTGCDLCLEPCPVDCIDMLEVVADKTDVRTHRGDEPEIACINCGQCAPACPRDLQPQLLYWYRQDREKLTDHDLDQCIECGRCDRVCPSTLPLTQTFHRAKILEKEFQRAKLIATETEQRFQSRTSRLATSDKRVKRRPSMADRKSLLSALQEQQEQEERS